MRDINLEDTIYHKFTTRAFATGIPTTLAGSPVLSIYEENNLTQITAGVSVTADYDSVTGLNQATIVATAANGYEAGKSYDLVITTGTVGGVSVVGEVVGSFTVEDSAMGLNATARAALEDQYDGTGVTGDTYPSTQAQVGNLAVGSAAIAVVSESDTVTTGTEVNTYAVTDEVDGVYHEITDVAGAMELYYQFDIGGNGIASSVQMTGRLTSANDSIGVYAYNWGAAGWDQIGTLAGTGGTADGVEVFNLLTRHTGTGANLGKVRVRGYAASGLTSATLYIDQAFVAYAIIAQSVGYDGGQVWIDTTHGTAGTETYVNGVADNPALTLADAITIASNLSLHRFTVSNESTITYAESHAAEVWSGDGWALALGGQDISQTHIYHCNDVSGTGTTPTGEAHILDSHLGAITLGASHITNCLFSSTFTAGAAADYFIDGGGSGIAGGGAPTLTYSGNGASSNINARKWSGGATWVFDADCTASIEVLVGGTHTITTGGGDVEFRGTPKAVVLTTSGAGTTNIIVNSGAPITINGTGGTVNIYGLHGGITDNSSGTTITDSGADVKDLPAVLADTNELQTAWTNGGRLDLILDAVLAMLDAPRGEPGQGAPLVNPDMATKMDYLYKWARNVSDNDGSTIQHYDDAGTTVDQKRTVSEAAGTVTKGEMATGP